ncbi:hypothetical protein [Raoultella lignicola]|uniref:Small hydrophobic protein n=1 Tax=Raoultella lignicola TaxID=3040939 RepID=A0ABU9F964_9ENTR
MEIEMLTGILLFVFLAVFLIIVVVIYRNEAKKMEKRITEFRARREELRREFRNRF